jgi:hypothetical protein
MGFAIPWAAEKSSFMGYSYQGEDIILPINELIYKSKNGTTDVLKLFTKLSEKI